MKDALGHGSNGNAGVHAAPIKSLPRGMRVEKQMATVRTAAGQRVTNVNAWQKVASGRRQAVAERIAQNMRVDNPNSRIRVR